MSKRVRLLLALLLSAMGVWFLYPTINWYLLLDNETKVISSKSRIDIRKEATQFAQKEYEVLVTSRKAKPDAPFGDEYSDLLDHAKKYYSDNKIPNPEVWTNKLVFGTFESDTDPATGAKTNFSTELLNALVKKYRDHYIGIKNQKNRIIQLGLDLQGGISAVLQANTDKLKVAINKAVTDEAQKRDPSQTEIKDALDNAVENLKGRFDKFGVSEPAIRADYENKRVTIDLPGDADEDQIRTVLTSSGDLKLQLVDETATAAFTSFVAKFAQDNNRLFDFSKDLELVPAGTIPAGTTIRPVTLQDDYGIDYDKGYIVTKESAENVVAGEHIVSARPSRDNAGKVTVDFKLDLVGADLFGKLTAANVEKPLAIILNGKSRGTPINIKSAITGGNVQISGAFSTADADALAKVLRSASLPLDFSIEGIEKVGASLGPDSIQKGVYALALGFILVAGFMVIYYLGSGLVANFALIINTFFIMAVLSAFGLTLTLVSIAGLILTVGMSVDSNVIIFERIKDELRLGKDRASAVRSGYQKAFWTIVDGHVTTLIASVLLGFLGTGPIKGFAVTLTVGIIINLYTSLVLTRLIQDFSTEQLKLKKMSISWRRF